MLSHKFAFMLDGMEEVGRRLRSARMQRGLSQRAAADAAGFSEATWRHLESGTFSPSRGIEAPYNPSDKTLLAAATTVGEDPGPLFELLGRPAPAATSKAPDALDVLGEARQSLRHALTKLEAAAAMLERGRRGS